MKKYKSQSATTIRLDDIKEDLENDFVHYGYANDWCVTRLLKIIRKIFPALSNECDRVFRRLRLYGYDLLISNIGRVQTELSPTGYADEICLKYFTRARRTALSHNTFSVYSAWNKH